MMDIQLVHKKSSDRLYTLDVTRDATGKPVDKALNECIITNIITLKNDLMAMKYRKSTHQYREYRDALVRKYYKYFENDYGISVVNIHSFLYKEMEL